MIGGDGPFIVANSVKNPAGRAVAADGSAAFPGQVFFHPGPGTVGSLQRRYFSGPWASNVNLSVLKHFKISERQQLILRGEAFNVPNHPTFFIGDQSVTSTNFGKITSLQYDRRILQAGLQYRF